MRFSVNLDVTSYKNGQRETHNPSGRALAPVVWDFYQVICLYDIYVLHPNGYSIDSYLLATYVMDSSSIPHICRDYK